MKYFKITNITTGKEYFIASDLPFESPAHVAISQHLDPEFKWNIEEVYEAEFYGLSKNSTK